MSRVFVGSIVTLVAGVALAACLSCGDDDEPAGGGPTGSISGTVFFRGTWPSTGNIYVTVNSAYPPTGAPDAFTTPITETMVTMPGRTFDYTLGGIETGTYVAVLIGWRGGPGQDKCLGMYWEHVDSLGVAANCDPAEAGIEPSPVTVTKGDTTEDVDMVADLNLWDD